MRQVAFIVCAALVVSTALTPDPAYNVFLSDVSLFYPDRAFVKLETLPNQSSERLEAAQASASSRTESR